MTQLLAANLGPLMFDWTFQADARFYGIVEAYERKVSRIMARYGGVIERAIRTSKPSDDEPFEVHVLRFPSRDRYDAYRDDAERRSLSGERAGIITNTDTLVGTPGPAYAAD